MPEKSPIIAAAEDMLLGYVHGAGQVTKGISGLMSTATEPGSFAARRLSKSMSGKIHSAAKKVHADASKTLADLEPKLGSYGRPTSMVAEHIPDLLMSGKGMVKAAANFAQGVGMDYGKEMGVGGTLSGIAAARLIRGNSAKANVKQMVLENAFSKARLDPPPRG